MDMPPICFHTLAALIRKGLRDAAEDARRAWACGRHAVLPATLPVSAHLRRQIVRADREAVGSRWVGSPADCD